MIKGGTLQNAVVVQGRPDPQRGGPLRFPDEFVRHKILDLLGDLCLLGRPLQGHMSSRFSRGTTPTSHFVKPARQSRTGGVRGRGSPLDRVHFDIAAIERIMPHRYPMLLVDRILLLEERRRVVGLKNVTINEPFFVGHFPGHPIMPAVLIIEAMAQAGGVLLLNTVDDPDTKLVYFMGIDKAKFRRPVLPGRPADLRPGAGAAEEPDLQDDRASFVRGELVAEADLLSTIVDR